MPLAPDTLNAIVMYVEIRGNAFDIAYRWMQARGYPPSDCQHFATLLVTMMFMDTSTGMKDDERLKALMQAMTPGGRA